MTVGTWTKLAGALAIATVTATAWAQADKPISLVLGYTPGGTTDFVARTVAAELSKALGRQVIVDNVPGASGMLGAQKVSNAPADGNMIYLGGTDTVVIPMVNQKIKVDWAKDYVPIGRSTYVSMILAVNAKSPYNNLSDLFSAIRKGKTDFNYATPGIGTMQHLYGALISKNAKVPLKHIPYKGGAQVATDLVGGHIDSAVLTTTSSAQFLKDGSIKALSIADNARSPMLPNVKSLGEEEGFSSVSLPLWHAFFLKAGTPPVIVAVYEKALMNVVNNPAVQAKFREAGATPWPMAGKELSAYIKSQAAIYHDVIDSAKIVNQD